MSIEISDVSETRKQCVVLYPCDNFVKDYEQKVRSFRGQLPGFRPGKVPRNVVEKRCASAFRQELIDAQMRQGWEHITQKYQPVGSPEIHIQPEKLWTTASSALDSDIKITISFDVPPVITPFDIHQLGLSLQPMPPEDPKERELFLSYLARQHGTEHPSEEPARQGDVVYADIMYLEDNKKEEDLKFTLTEEEIHPEFVANLVGKKELEQVNFEYTPIKYNKKGHHDHSDCDHHDHASCGHEHAEDSEKPLSVSVTIKKIARVTLATKEQIYKALFPNTDWDAQAFEEYVTKQLKSMAFKKYFKDNEEKVIEHLLALHPVEIPSAHYKEKHFATEQEKQDFEKNIRVDYIFQSYQAVLSQQVSNDDLSFFAEIFCEESSIPQMLFYYFLRSDKKFQQQFYHMVAQRSVVKAIIEAALPSNTSHPALEASEAAPVVSKKSKSSEKKAKDDKKE
jgi:trigger factor